MCVRKGEKGLYLPYLAMMDRILLHVYRAPGKEIERKRQGERGLKGAAELGCDMFVHD